MTPEFVSTAGTMTIEQLSEFSEWDFERIGKRQLNYIRFVKELYDWLGPDKFINVDKLNQFKNTLMGKLCVSDVNQVVSKILMYLRYIGVFGSTITTKFEDYTGKRFGQLEVLGMVRIKNRAYWACRCDCGEIVNVLTTDLNSGRISCCSKCRPLKITRKRGIEEQMKSDKNKSGFVGVYPTNPGRWTSRVTVNRKVITLGTFGSPEEASAARERYLAEHTISKDQVWIVTGDTHGQLAPLSYIRNKFKDSDLSLLNLVILGDSGFNFGFRVNSEYRKAKANEMGFKIYCVRGNHEDRPEHWSKEMRLVYDEAIEGEVWYEPQYPNIRYFTDGGIYNIDGLKTLVIGGAYSVDKHWRLKNGDFWYPLEQLSREEMETILTKVRNQKFDLVLTHTCPVLWQPRDMFISGLDQKTVDTSMEDWLEVLRTEIKWKYWMFGHYHVDRQVTSKVRAFYMDIMLLSDAIKNREKLLGEESDELG